jgi:hypothetical protein
MVIGKLGGRENGVLKHDFFGPSDLHTVYIRRRIVIPLIKTLASRLHALT